MAKYFCLDLFKLHLTTILSSWTEGQLWQHQPIPLCQPWQTLPSDTSLPAKRYEDDELGLWWPGPFDIRPDQSGRRQTCCQERRLIIWCLLSPQDHFYVVTDSVGDPLLVFRDDGALVKEISRSPYGQITYDSNPSIRIPIGIFGGIQVTFSLHCSLLLWCLQLSIVLYSVFPTALSKLSQVSS